MIFLLDSVACTIRICTLKKYNLQKRTAWTCCRFSEWYILLCYIMHTSFINNSMRIIIYTVRLLTIQPAIIYRIDTVLENEVWAHYYRLWLLINEWWTHAIANKRSARNITRMWSEIGKSMTQQDRHPTIHQQKQPAAVILYSVHYSTHTHTHVLLLTTEWCALLQAVIVNAGCDC
jgi:hypothetical protein